MKRNIIYLSGMLAIVALMILGGCKKTDYKMGDLNAPSNIVVDAMIAGQDASHPDGDGSGDVTFTITANNALAYKIDFDANTAADLIVVPGGVIKKKYTNLGLNSYTVTVVVYGKGGSSSIVTKDISVRSDFTPDPGIVTNLTNDASKTWRVDKDIPAHFGVGPWDVNSIRPEWYAAAPNEKAACCGCFYSASFIFSKVAGSGTFTLESVTPDGVFTKTGTLAGGLPGVPASGAEGCYPYGGGTNAFTFVPASSNAPAVGVGPNSGSTMTSILLAGNNTFIGYGAVLKEFEILEITPTTMYLRVQGTETGNAWYLRLVSP